MLRLSDLGLRVRYMIDHRMRMDRINEDGEIIAINQQYSCILEPRTTYEALRLDCELGS